MDQNFGGCSKKQKKKQNLKKYPIFLHAEWWYDGFIFFENEIEVKPRFLRN